MTQGIYSIRNTVTGAVYIGSSMNIEARWREHRNTLIYGKHRNRYLQRAWNKYGAEVFIFAVVEVVYDTAYLLDREQEWIDRFFHGASGVSCYNIAPIAGNNMGVKLTDETKRKLSVINTGKTLTTETKHKLSEAMKGKAKTEEHCLNISNGKKGWVPSEATRQRFREARLGGKLSEETRRKQSISHSQGKIYAVISPSGEIYKNIVNLAQFAREHGLNRAHIYSVAVGNRQSHQGWKTYEKRDDANHPE